MTWNPRDASKPPDASFLRREAADASPVPVTREWDLQAPAHMPVTVPSLATAFDTSEDAVPAMSAEILRELAQEGIFPTQAWDRWRTMMLRGYPDF